MSKKVKFSEQIKNLKNEQVVMGNKYSEVIKGVINPCILDMDSNYIVVDPDGQILSSVGAALTLQGYNVKVFDLITRTHNTYNPFSYMQYFEDIDNFASCTAAIVLELSESKMDTNMVNDLIAAATYHVLSVNGEFGCLKNVIETLEFLSKVEDPQDIINEDPDEVLKKLYAKFFDAAKGDSRIIIEKVFDVLNNLSDDLIFTTSSDNVELDRLMEEKYALFITIPTKKQDVENFYLSALIGSYIDVLLMESNVETKVFYPLFLSYLFPNVLTGEKPNVKVFAFTDPETKDNENLSLYKNSITITKDSLVFKDGKGEEKVEKKYNLKQHPNFKFMKMTFEELERNKREFKGMFVKEVFLQFLLKVPVDPEKILKIAEYATYEVGPERESIIKDAYEASKSLYMCRDYNLFTAYIVKACDCEAEFNSSSALLKIDDNFSISDDEAHQWYMYLLNYLRAKITISDPACDLYPAILQYLLYSLTLDKNETYCNLYDYFYNTNITHYYEEDGFEGNMLTTSSFAEEGEDDKDKTELTSIIINDETADEKGYNQEKIDECLKELDGLIGLEKEKEVIHEIVNIIIGNRMREECGNKPFPISSYHIAFTGNPGTGKTTVARIYSKILHYCGILSKGSLLEVGRVDLVGGYLGQTAIKTKKVIEQAKGGILFIDEAYSLVSKSDDTYGLECVSTLVQNMENMKNELAIVLAGYTKEMDDFLKTNPGLKSRIYNVVEFKDYTLEELMLIFDKLADEKGFVISDELREEIKKKVFVSMKNKHFGNARGVRNFVDVLTKSLLSRTVKENLRGEAQNIITKEDVDKIVIAEQAKRTIGFNV